MVVDSWAYISYEPTRLAGCTGDKGAQKNPESNKNKKKETHQQNAELPETTAAKITVRSDLELGGFTGSDASL